MLQVRFSEYKVPTHSTPGTRDRDVKFRYWMPPPQRFVQSPHFAQAVWQTWREEENSRNREKKRPLKTSAWIFISYGYAKFPRFDHGHHLTQMRWTIQGMQSLSGWSDCFFFSGWGSPLPLHPILTRPVYRCGKQIQHHAFETPVNFFLITCLGTTCPFSNPTATLIFFFFAHLHETFSWSTLPPKSFRFILRSSN